MSYVITDNCDVKIEGTSGIIESPNYPENYPMYSHCVYQIHGPVGTRIWIQMEETDLEKKYDFVTVYKHGIIGDDKYKRRYTGIHNNYKDINMPNHCAAIVFTSDGTVSKKGFRLTWEARDHACKTSSKLTAEWTPQDLYSPGFQTNDNYPEESTCVWMIKTSTDQCDSQDDPENINGDESLVSTCRNTDVDVCDGWNDIVTLQFIAFETEDSSDFVTVFNSRGHTHKVLDVFSGSSLPRPLITTARFMRVELTSDSDNTFKGFHATYKKGCADIIMDQRCGTITSPGYDIAKYKNKVECSWKMVHPDGSAITVLFDAFKLRLTDHICVFDGMDKNDEVLLTEYNGGLKGNIAPPPLRSEDGNIYMVFYSDRKKRNEGFYARFSQAIIHARYEVIINAVCNYKLSSGMAVVWYDSFVSKSLMLLHFD
ncbi:bone morphogenetic protein 1-like [Glandiceps talaboti]